MLQRLDNALFLRDITNALFELGVVDTLTPEVSAEATLRDDLGLDSQEVVSLAELVSSLTLAGSALEDDGFETIDQAVAHLAAHRDCWLPRDVPFVLQGQTVIRRPLETVFDYIADYQAWPEALAHVSAIEPEYDDGRLQTFKMHIEELGTGEAYFVQSWRYVNAENGIIDFTQPRPPKGFKMHKGGWRFRALDENRTALISYHGFDLEDTATAETAIELIRKHIKAALSTWARVGDGRSDD